MPDVTIVAVQRGVQQRAFVRFPWTLYRDDPHWVPPLVDNQKRLLGYKPHPFHEIAEVQTFLAQRHGQTVGRVAAILNREHNRVHREQRGFFGFFECIDDQAVADALLDAVMHWFAQRGIDAVRGPCNPSMNYVCGLLVEGFDSPPTFMMTYNPPYYGRLLEGYGFRKAHDLLAYVGHVSQLPEVDRRLGTTVEMIRERMKARVRPMDTSRFRQECELFLNIYNRACERMWGFVPLTPGELQALAGSLKHLLVPELALACECDGRTVGAVLGLPDFNPAIKRIGGRLFPLGWLRLIWSKRHVKRFRVLSIDVVPEYQAWGLGLLLMNGLVPKVLEMGIEEAEFSWISETNTLARGGLEKGGARLAKRYRIYDVGP